jgi:hypothetical protein
MSSPPRRPQRMFNPPKKNPGEDKDAPREGRLADIGGRTSSELTRGGNTKMKFNPKPVARKSADRYFFFMEDAKYQCN